MMAAQTRNSVFLSSLLVILIATFFSSSAPALRLKYNELRTKDYEEMLKMVNDHIRKSKELAIEKQEEGDSEGGDQLAIEELTKALKLVLSRPDEDNTVAKLMPSVKRELMNYNAYTDTLNAVVTDAISSLEMKKLPAVYRATSIFVLENLMSEIKPELDENSSLLSIVKKIKKSKIEVSRDVRNHRKLTAMYSTTSPSKTAELILKARKKRNKKGKKKKDDDDD